MKFYFFGGFAEKHEINILEESGFDGVLFTYDNTRGDLFTKIANTINTSQKIKYMVAIRPYTISPQYLCMINSSLSTIAPGRLQLNLIAGHVKDHEKQIGGILGSVNDSSSKIEKSNYLIDFIHSINQINVDRNFGPYVPDYYISTTNEYVFDAAKQHSNKIVVQYKDYKKRSWTEYDEKGQPRDGKTIDVSGLETMLSIGPRIRNTQDEIDKLVVDSRLVDTEFFTYDQFKLFIDKLESEGINSILMFCVPAKEKQYILDFVKKYKTEMGIL